ncbi:MAG: BrnT family toxin [Oxalobacter formigenes]|nr:BrnT family toxin [Oxalobacter formigenes]
MRYVTVGLPGDKVVVMAHTETEDEIRIISRRKAQRYERERYFASF